MGGRSKAARGLPGRGTPVREQSSNRQGWAAAARTLFRCTQSPLWPPWNVDGGMQPPEAPGPAAGPSPQPSPMWPQPPPCTGSRGKTLPWRIHGREKGKAPAAPPAPARAHGRLLLPPLCPGWRGVPAGHPLVDDVLWQQSRWQAVGSLRTVGVGLHHLAVHGHSEG